MDNRQTNEKLSDLNKELTKEIQELRISEKRFRTLITIAPDIVYCLDSKGKFVFINNSIKNLGYCPEDLIGEHFSVIIHPDYIESISRDRILSNQRDKKGTKKADYKLFDERRSSDRMSSDLEVRLLPKNENQAIKGSANEGERGQVIDYKERESFFYEVNSFGMYEINRQGKEFTGTIGVIRDITKRKKLQEKLIKSEKLAILGRVAGSISHDLRNPLSIIDNSASFLSELLTDNNEKVQNQIDIILRAVERTKNIVNDLLDFSKLKPLSLKKHDLNKIIMEVLSHIEKPEEIVVETIMDEGLPEVLLDKTQIERMFNNIISNACMAMENGGRLTISSRLDEVNMETEAVTIDIADTGSGIKKEHLKRVFDPLFTTRKRGTGFGLAIVKDIIEKHRGSLNVESQCGKGTVFTIILPLLRK